MTTVLVVDDEFLVAEVITLALEDIGFKVLQASDGKRALEVLERETPSLIISDFMMPAMNGVELAEALKKNSKWGGVPIILITGGHVAQAQQNSQLFDQIMLKPFDIEMLSNTVIKLIKP
jgi:CheY-like chemotaxis protein